MKHLGLVLVAACGASAPQPNAKVEGRNALLDASGNAHAIEDLFHGTVTNGGLWFADPACEAKFALGGDVKPNQLGVFAQCLAALKFQASTREDLLGDVVVMSYPPGIEIEVRMVNEESGPHLAWIGFESRRAVDALIPTITSEAFESIRLSGDRNGPIEGPPKAASSDPERAWLRVCVDETGKVTLAHTFSTTDYEVSAAFEKAALAWTFKPFTVDTQILPVCSMVHMTYPPGPSGTEQLPLPPPPTHSHVEPITFSDKNGHSMVEGHRVSGTKLIAPDDEIKTKIGKSNVDKVVTTFRLCIDEAGNVESILPLRSSGYASYDRKLIAGMQGWKYAPYLLDNKPVPVCTGVTFIYVQH